MDHVRELQGRLFAVAIVFVVVAAAAYPFFDKVINFLVAPLGEDHELVYLTPGGAFSFIIQVCMYIGFIGALPAIIYNTYRFIMPAMKRQNGRRALVFTVVSLVLAIAGMLFAYYVSLPAALYFLTSFNLYHINPMLTIDSYFSFVMTYMFAGAILFQIPLIMLMINGATPLKPTKLMKYQDKIILGSFIVAAIISPTPDVLNQALLASPMIVMYQAGIILVWLRNRRHVRTVVETATVPRETEAVAVAVTHPVSAPLSSRPVLYPAASQASRMSATKPVKNARYGIDGFAVRQPNHVRTVPHLQRPLPTVQRKPEQQSVIGFRSAPRRSIDGFVVSA